MTIDERLHHLDIVTRKDASGAKGHPLDLKPGRKSATILETNGWPFVFLPLSTPIQ